MVSIATMASILNIISHENEAECDENKFGKRLFFIQALRKNL